MAPEVPDDQNDPSGVCVPVTPLFINAERLVLARFWSATAA
jgi:hypothetical protein